MKCCIQLGDGPLESVGSIHGLCFSSLLSFDSQVWDPLSRAIFRSIKIRIILKSVKTGSDTNGFARFCLFLKLEITILPT